MTDAFKRPSPRKAARRGASAITPTPASAAAASPPPAKAAPPEAEAARRRRRAGRRTVRPRRAVRSCSSRRRTSSGTATARSWPAATAPTAARRPHDDRTAAEMEAARKLRQGRPPKPKKEAPAAGLRAQQGRLPHGSRFDVAYDAAAEALVRDADDPRGRGRRRGAGLHRGRVRRVPAAAGRSTAPVPEFAGGGGRRERGRRRCVTIPAGRFHPPPTDARAPRRPAASHILSPTRTGIHGERVMT